MAQTIQLKRSATAGNIPTSSDLALGEIAINTADGAVYIKKGNNDIVAVHDNDILHIDTTNSRVGIGTTSPTGSNLHIAEAGDPTILLEDTDSSNQVKIRYKTTTTEWTAGLHGGVDKWKIAKAAGFGTNDYLVVDASGRVGIGTDSPVARFQVEEYGIDTTETSTSATTQTVIHTMSASDFRSARFTIQVTNSTDSTYHTTEILMVHDGTTANITEFGKVFTANEEATFDADVSSGNVRLLATPATTDSMEFKVVCHSVTV